MSKVYMNGSLISGSTNYASTINCLDKDGSQSTVQAEIDGLHDNLGGLRFGIDENGNVGYIKEGADSVTPFKKESMIVGAARRDGSPYPQGELYTFTEDYEEINCIVYSYRTSTAKFEEVPNTWFENCDSYKKIGNAGYACHYKLYGVKTGTIINYYGSTDTTYQTFIFFT